MVGLCQASACNYLYYCSTWNFGTLTCNLALFEGLIQQQCGRNVELKKCLYTNQFSYYGWTGLVPVVSGGYIEINCQAIP